jgi:hypothetical protein
MADERDVEAETEVLLAKCVECGAETQLYRANIPYCVTCMDRIFNPTPSPTIATS